MIFFDFLTVFTIFGGIILLLVTWIEHRDDKHLITAKGLYMHTRKMNWAFSLMTLLGTTYTMFHVWITLR